MIRWVYLLFKRFKGIQLTKEQDDLVLYMSRDITRILKKPAYKSTSYEVLYNGQCRVDWYKVCDSTILSLVKIGVLVSFNSEDKGQLSLYDTDWRRRVLYEVTYNEVDKEKSALFDFSEEGVVFYNTPIKNLKQKIKNKFILLISWFKWG